MRYEIKGNGSAGSLGLTGGRRGVAMVVCGILVVGCGGGGGSHEGIGDTSRPDIHVSADARPDNGGAGSGGAGFGETGGGHRRVPGEAVSPGETVSPGGATGDSIIVGRVPEGADTSLAPAIEVIRAYYNAIAEHNYRGAYRLWSNQGEGSGQRFEEFQRGYWQTRSVDITIGTPGRVDAAAGSRYVDIPVTLKATMKDGTIQHYSGHYTLRRSVVTGATADQQAWRIYSAAITQRKV